MFGTELNRKFLTAMINFLLLGSENISIGINFWNQLLLQFYVVFNFALKAVLDMALTEFKNSFHESQDTYWPINFNWKQVNKI